LKCFVFRVALAKKEEKDGRSKEVKAAKTLRDNRSRLASRNA